ncbi:hypothetical protein DSM109990_01728 [Sulfitobacter dubius]|uniref:Uncharacterized protein n=2 Tax=Sulfitobacter dubius TaxID=218673 RepID=A0ABY3ZJS4_9RHOB|nr:hypothetical protein DSM109990_01728 [Sulfitobacter dubius]
MTPHSPQIGQVTAVLREYLQGTTVPEFGELAVMLSNILWGSSSYQQSNKPPKAEKAEKTEKSEKNQNSAPKAEAKPASEPQATQNSAAAQEATKSQSVQAPAKTQAVQAVAQTKSVETAPKASDADSEAFARAATQRNVESVRTRALLDTIAPVNNSAVKAAKSYVTKVEPQSQDGTANNAASAAKSAVDKAA